MKEATLFEKTTLYSAFDRGSLLLHPRTCTWSDIYFLEDGPFGSQLSSYFLLLFH